MKKQFPSSILWNWFRYWALDLIVVVVVCAEKRKFKMKNVQYESITNIAYRCGERKELVWQVERVCMRLRRNWLWMFSSFFIRICVAKCCLWACQISTSWISYFVSFYGILKIEFEKGLVFTYFMPAIMKAIQPINSFRNFIGLLILCFNKFCCQRRYFVWLPSLWRRMKQFSNWFESIWMYIVLERIDLECA